MFLVVNFSFGLVDAVAVTIEIQCDTKMAGQW